MEKLYKVLNKDGRDPGGGATQWGLPESDEPGEWMPPGIYSLLRAEDLVKQLGPVIYEAEARGEFPCGHSLWKGQGVSCGQARLLRRLGNWDERTARLFACDCAEAVLPMVWRRGQCKWAITTAGRYAYGKVTEAKLAHANFVIRRMVGRPEGSPGVIALLVGIVVLAYTHWPWVAIGWVMLCLAAWRLTGWAWAAVKRKVSRAWGDARDYATLAAASAANPDPWEAAKDAANEAAEALAHQAIASTPGAGALSESFLAGFHAARSRQAKRLMDYLR